MKRYSLFFLIYIITLFSQPVTPVRMCAEWEPALGTLIRYPLGIPSELVVGLAEDDKLFVLVENNYQQNTAISQFTGWNVNMDNVRFITAPTYSHWTRDWGPVSAFDGDGNMIIVDPWFDGYPWVSGGVKSEVEKSEYKKYRGYEEDDEVNSYVANYLGVTNYELPAYFTGGNTLTDGENSMFFTQQMIDENAPYMPQAEFYRRLSNHLGLDNIHVLPNPEIYGIQHIDCWVKMVDEETFIIKEVPAWHPEYDSFRAIETYLGSIESCFGRPYTIHKIYCDSYDLNSLAAYTNSYTINGKVFVPLFGISSDDDALLTYSDAMPGYEIIGIYYDDWYYYDALHCRTREIMESDMIRIGHRSLDNQGLENDYRVSCYVKDYSGNNISLQNSKLYYKISDNEWESTTFTEISDTDSLVAYIPQQTENCEISYYIEIINTNDKSQTKPEVAPEGHYTFSVLSTGVSEQPEKINLIKNYPNPFNPETTIEFTLEKQSNIELSVYNITGERVATLFNGIKSAGVHKVNFNGSELTSGIYYYQLTNDSKILNSSRMVLLK